MTRAALTARMSQVLELARLRPFDTSTEAGRSKERYRRIAHTAAAQGFSRVISVVTALVSVPLTVHYLGKEQYGVWLTISAFVGMLSFADLGLGNGLISEVSAAHGREDWLGARRSISNATAMLLGSALVVGALFAAAYPLLNFGAFFNVHEPAVALQAGRAMAVMIACFALNMPLAVVQRTLVGMQEGVSANIWSMLGNVLQLGMLWIVIRARGDLPWLVAALQGAPLLVTAMSAVYVFGFHHRRLAPRLSDVHKPIALGLLRMGVLFLILQVASSLAFTSDNIVIAQVLGSGAVTRYGVPARMFGVTGMLTSALLAPLWPAYGESFARGDTAWVHRTLKRSLLLTLLATVAMSLPMVVFGKWLVALWIRDASLNPSYSLLAAFGVWSVLQALGTTAAMFFNGCHRLMPQVICAIALAVVGLVAKIVGARWADIEGVAWSTVISYTVTAAIPLALVMRGILRRMDRGASGMGQTPEAIEQIVVGTVPGAPPVDTE